MQDLVNARMHGDEKVDKYGSLGNLLATNEDNSNLTDEELDIIIYILWFSVQDDLTFVLQTYNDIDKLT